MSQLLNNTSSLGNTSVTIENKGSKKDKARQVYISNPNLTRDQFVDLIVKDLDIRENSARTYASQFAKEHNVELGKPYKSRKIDNSNSKKQKAYEIYAANSNLSRKEIIALIQNELSVTENAASTHCSYAAKQFKLNTK